MRLHRALSLALLLLTLAGCASFKRQTLTQKPPQLRTRPQMTGPKNTVNLACAESLKTGGLEWYDAAPNVTGWCEVTQQANGTFDVLCHDLTIKHIPNACLMVSAK